MINDSDYLCFKYDDVIIDKIFVDTIKSCCYVNSVKKEVIACLVSDGKEVLGIRLDDNGTIIGKSSLIFDEEEEVLEELDDLKVYNINYIIINRNNRKIISRCITDRRSYLLDFFNSNNNIDIYRYIYYDFYEEEANDIKMIKNKLLNVLCGEWNSDCERLYQSIKMISGVKQ
jgi:hypothetical protein